jgi:hypothetical protein
MEKEGQFELFRQQLLLFSVFHSSQMELNSSSRFTPLIQQVVEVVIISTSWIVDEPPSAPFQPSSAHTNDYTRCDDASPSLFPLFFFSSRLCTIPFNLPT